MFRSGGYRAFCERHGMQVDESRFDAAVASAASLLDGPEDAPYDAEIFVRYTRHIIEQMGGRGPGVEACAREIYARMGAPVSISSSTTTCPPCCGSSRPPASGSG